MAAKTEKGSEVKDFTTDPIDSDKVLGFKNSDGTRWWSLSRFWDWIKSKTASTITAGDKTPVNSDAVNGALTNYLPKISIAIGDGAHNSVPISTIGDGTYVVMLSALYSNWNIFYIGVLCIYGNDIRLDTVSHNGFSVTADRSNIYTNVTLSSARLIPFGYWG